MGSGAEPQGQISDSSVSLTGGATGTGARWERGGRTGQKREGERERETETKTATETETGGRKKEEERDNGVERGKETKKEMTRKKPSSYPASQRHLSNLPMMHPLF